MTYKYLVAGNDGYVHLTSSGGMSYGSYTSLATTLSALSSFVLAGDVNGSAATNHVDTLTGPGSGIVGIAASMLQWKKGVSLPTITQATPTSDVAATNLLIQPQSPFAGALTNQATGNVLVNFPTPVVPSNDGYYGQLQVQNAGTTIASIESHHGKITAGGGDGYMEAVIGPMSGSETNFAAIYLVPHNTSLTTSNAVLYSDGANQIAFNSPGTSPTYFWQAQASTFTTLTTSALTLTTVPTVQWGTTVSPAVTQITPASDVVTHNMAFTSQAPFSGAVTNINSGNFIFNVPASVSGSPYGQGLNVQYGGTSMVRLATYAGTNFGAIWFLDGGNPASNNWAFLGNTTTTQFNAPTATGEMYFAIGNQPYLTIGAPTGSTLPGLSFGVVYTTPDYIFDFSHTAVQHFTVNATSAAIKYDPQTTDTSTKNLTITAQGPWSGALTNQATGNVIVNFPAPVVTSNDGYYGQFQVQGGSTDGYIVAKIEAHHGKITAGGGGLDTLAVIGPLIGSETAYSSLHLLQHGVAVSGTNYAILADSAGQLYLNAPSGGAQTLLLAGGSQYGGITPTRLTLGNPGALLLDWSTSTAPFIQSGTGATSLTIGTTDTAQTSITINATQAAATTSGGNITIAPQAGGATSGIPGSLLLNIAAPNGGSSEGFVVVERATTPMVRLGPYTGAPTSFGAIYFLDGGSPGTTNWAFLGSASDTYFNAPTSNMYFKIANNTIAMGATSAHVDFGGATSASVTPALTIDFSGGVTTPIIKTGNTATTTTLKVGITAMTADVANGNLTIQGAYAFSSATGTHRTPGNVIFDIGAPTNSGTTEAAFQFTRNGSTIGQLGISNSSQYSLWLGASAFTVSNAVLYADGASFTYVNAPTNVGVVIGDSTFSAYWSSTAMFFGGTSNAPLTVNWSTSTTPFIQSGTSATSLTVGTNKAGASTILQGDAGITALTLSGSQNGIATFAGAIDGYVRSSTANFTVDSGSNDYYIWATATQIITLPAPTKGRTLWLIVDATGGSAVTININRHGSENINGVAANFPAFTVPGNSVAKYLIISPDGTNWIFVD